MCEALRELFADELEEKYRESVQKVNNLNVKLIELGRTDDMIKAASDRGFQERLFEELGI